MSWLFLFIFNPFHVIGAKILVEEKFINFSKMRRTFKKFRNCFEETLVTKIEFDEDEVFQLNR